MKFKNVIILLIVIISQLTGYSQYYGDPSGDKQRAKDNKVYNQQQLDRANVNKNTPYVRNTEFSAAEKQQLNDWWYSIWGKPSTELSDERRKEIAEGSRRYREQEEISRKKLSDEHAKKREDAKPYRELLIQKGMTEQEATNLSDNYINQKNGNYGKYSKVENDFYSEAVETGNYIGYFYQNIETADFDALKLCIEKATAFGATITANTLSNFLITKYPAREPDLESTQTEIFKKYFNDWGSKGNYFENNKTVIDDYFAFEAKNPKVNLIILNSLKTVLPYDAYDMTTNHYDWRADCPKCHSGKENREDRANFEKLMLQEIQVKAKNGIANCKINPYQMLLDEKKSNSDLFRKRYYDNNNGYTFIGYGSKGYMDFGIATFDDGRVYYGSFKNANKKCVFIFKNKTIFEGTTKAGFKPIEDGEGKITFPNGFYVTANFKNNIPEKATYFNESGSVITKEEFDKLNDINSLEK